MDDVTRWREWLIAAGRPRTTVQLRTYQLRRFCERHPQPLSATPDDLASYLAAQDWSGETRRSFRAALVSFYRWAVLTGRLDASPATALPPVTVRQPPPRPAPELVVTAALQAADERCRLMAHLAARCGLRRGEIAQVRAEDLERDLIGWTLRVQGKGGRVRLVPCPDDLAAWVRRSGPGWVFPGQIDGHLSPAHVGRIMRTVLPSGWTLHTLRHRYATVCYRGSHNLLAVQSLLGHAKPETTQRYVALDSDALRSAARWAA